MGKIKIIKIELDKSVPCFEQQRRIERVFILLLGDNKNDYAKRGSKLETILGGRHERIREPNT